MFLLAAASCGMVSCQQEEGLTSPTLAKSSTDENIKVGNYTINIDNQNKTAIIGEITISKGEDVVIPEYITYNNVIYTVSGVGKGTFKTWDVFENANSVRLPSTLKSIGSYFFYKYHFKSIEIPDSVESIGTGAFIVCI